MGRNTKLDDRVVGWDLADWKSAEELDELFADIQVVIHAGAAVHNSRSIDESCIFDTNVRACFILGRWAISRGVPIVHISSSTVYANIGTSGLNEDGPLGWSGLGGFYGLSKLLAEDVYIRLREQGLKLAVVRPSSLYGFGLPAAKMVSSFLAIARDGGMIELTPPVEDRFDFIHAADVAYAIVAILKKESWNTFNIASGSTISLQELAEICISLTGRGSISLKKATIQTRDAITRFSLNIDKAKCHLDWEPKISIKEGLELMMQESLYPNHFNNSH